MSRSTSTMILFFFPSILASCSFSRFCLYCCSILPAKFVYDMSQDSCCKCIIATVRRVADDPTFYLQGLRGVPHWGHLPAALQQALLVKIVESIITVLQSAAKELLDTIAKTQASLSKLGRVRNSPAAGNDGGLSDIEKTQEQLRLDILEFGRNVEVLLNHPATDLHAFEDLLRVAQGFPQAGAGNTSSSSPPGPPLPPAAASPATQQAEGSATGAS